jgi:hypothetical protein
MIRLQEYLELKEAVNDRFKWQIHGKQIESIYFDLTGKKSNCKTGCDFFQIIKELDKLTITINEPEMYNLNLVTKTQYAEQAFNYPSLGIDCVLGKDLTPAQIAILATSKRERLQFFEAAPKVAETPEPTEAPEAEIETGEKKNELGENE